MKTHSDSPLISGLSVIGIILFNFWIYVGFVLFSIFCFLISPFLFVLLKLFTFWPNKRIMRHLVWWYGRSWVIFIAPFVRTKTENLNNLRKFGSCVAVINHLSYFDTYFMGALPVRDVGLTLRSWPFKMYWYRVFMELAQYMDLEGTSWEGIAEWAAKEKETNNVILFFPEGHRSRDGKLQRFYSGAFKVACEQNLPVVPLCITGTDVLLPPGRGWVRPARVNIVALDPVFPKNYTGESAHVSLRKSVRQAMMRYLEDKDRHV